jgi:hypothetical protein
LSITIDAETAGGSKPNEIVQTPTSFTDLTQPEPSNAVRFHASQRAFNRFLKAELVIALPG